MTEHTATDQKVYWRGTVFVLTYHYDGITEREAYVLAQCYEEGKEFQIIQITGYHAGYLSGYVNKGILQDTACAITKDELIEAIKYNFLEPELDTLVIFDRLDLNRIYENAPQI